MWDTGREGRATAEQSAIQQALEEAVGQACESAAARQVARHMGLPASTVRAIDLRYLERWHAKRRKPPLRQMGVDEIYRGKKGKFLSVVCNLETAEPLWFGRERKKETLDDFFRRQLVSRQRKRRHPKPLSGVAQFFLCEPVE